VAAVKAIDRVPDCLPIVRTPPPLDSVMTESLPRFLLAWVLMNTAPAVVLPPFWLRAVSTHDSSEDLVAGMLALIGIVSFLVLSGVGNWLFMRHRGPHPIAWGMMTTAGAIIGVVSVGFVVYQGYDSVSLWYLKTGRALIDPSSTVLLLYALPTGLVLWHLQKRARLAQSNVLISRFD
jgi:O-antigen/teichoic acid export membrane protein